MRIGFFTDSYFPEIDGVTYTLKLWKQRLDDQGHEVFIIYPDSSEYTPDKNEIPVTSVSNPFYQGYNIPIPTGFKEFPNDLDIVHCHSPASIGLAGRIYAYLNDIPAVYTHHTPLEEYFIQAVKSKLLANNLGKAYVPLENQFLKSFTQITSNTEDIPRNIDTKKLAVGIDLEFFQPKENSFVNDLDLENPIAGYSGRLSPEKNVEKIIDIAEEFEGSLLIVGEGPRKEELSEKAPENVVFMDFLDREKLPEFYSGIDVFLTASTGDTLGLSPLEANACGTPVVAPDVYPFDETIKLENGRRFELGNSEDMAKKIEDCLEEDLDSRESVKKYSLEKTIEQLLNVYNQLV